MPADTKPTTFEELAVYARGLEDELAAVKARPHVPHPVTPATSQAIAAKLQGKVLPAARATRAAAVGPRVIVDMGGHPFYGHVVDVQADGQLLVELRPANQTTERTHDRALRELIKPERALLLPEGWPG